MFDDASKEAIFDWLTAIIGLCATCPVCIVTGDRAINAAFAACIRLFDDVSSVLNGYVVV